MNNTKLLIGDLTAVQEVFQNAPDLVDEVEELMNRGNDFLSAIQDVADWHRIEVEQLVPLLKRHKSMWARLQAEAVSLRMIIAPKTRGPRTRKSSAPAKESVETLE
jgi:hypothetical protein